MWIYNLKILVLKENNLSKFDHFDNFPLLTYLDISNNKFRSIEKGNIGNLPLLKTLMIDQNYLKSINSFFKLQNLSFLSVESNKTSDNSHIDKLSENVNLKELNLSNTPLSKSYNYRQNTIRRFINLIKLDNSVNFC